MSIVIHWSKGTKLYIYMKVIPLGLQCSVPDGIKKANLREYSYPFDWLWTPSKTTFEILSILLHDGIEKALDYMTTGYSYYQYHNNEHYTSVSHVTENQMNRATGLGITHFTINDEYKNKVRVRLERLLNDIKSMNDIIFIYADAANSDFNYHLDDVMHGTDATEYLVKIRDLIYPFHHNISFVYFCWNEREKENNIIEYVAYDYKNNWVEVSEIIKDYLIHKIENGIDTKYDCRRASVGHS